jgi:type III pantothenate kinase
MLLAVDIGNSNVVVGILDGDRVVRVTRLPTLREESAASAGTRLVAVLSATERAPIRAGIVASVLPALARTWAEALGDALGVRAEVVDHTTDTGVRLDVESPAHVGVDRYVNLAALTGRGAGALVVDCGTATTFDVLAPDDAFVGGVIAPGMVVCAEALTSRAPRLPPVPIEAPSRAIATNTVDAIRAGVVFGYAALVEGLVARTRGEASFPLMVYATGGLATTLAPHCPSFDVVDPDLTLRGLARIHARVSSK